MDVLLYRVGRNLNRAYRTAEAFGVERLLLLECSGKIEGALFGAEGWVTVEIIDRWPCAAGLLAVETNYRTPIWDVNWSSVHTVVVGGESVTLPRAVAEQHARIPMYGHIGCLTTEAALAIALYEWRRNGHI